MAERGACDRCRDTGWLVRGHYVCNCRAGDHAWAAWEGMTIEEYDARAAGTSDYHGSDPSLAAAVSRSKSKEEGSAVNADALTAEPRSEGT